MGMKKILIIEAQPSLLHYIHASIETSNLQMESVSSFKEMKALNLKEEYFLVLLETTFNKEELDNISYLINREKIPYIAVLSSEMQMLDIDKRLMVDSIVKDSPDAITYLMKTLKRIHENRFTKVLVVEDSPSDRMMMASLVKGQLYQVYEAANGTEALTMLEENPSIKIIVTDIHMPNMGGVKLLKYIRERKLQNELAVLGVSADHASLIRFLKLGGNDFVNKPFSKLEFVSRLNNLVSIYKHIQELDELSNRDFLTKLHSRKFFFEKAAPYVFSAYHDKCEHAIGMIDIDNFKAINDTYGHETGDRVIQSVAKVLHDGLKGSDIVARYGGEEFCVLLKDTKSEDAQKVFDILRQKVAQEVIHKLEVPQGFNIQFTVSVGVCTQADGSLDSMLAKADSLLYKAKRSGKNRVESSRFFELEEVV